MREGKGVSRQLNSTQDNHVNGDTNSSESNKWDRTHEEEEENKTDSAIERFQASSRLAIAAVTGKQGLADFVPSGKPQGSTSNSQTSLTHASEASSSRLVAQNATHQTLRSSGNVSSLAFDTFTDDSKAGLTLSPLRQQPVAPSFAEQESVDGLEVVQLLSLPHGTIEDEEYTLERDEMSPIAAAKLREALFNPTGTRPVWDELLDFKPEFLLSKASPEEGERYFGTLDTDVMKSIWLQQWGEVLSAYNEEVWGDLAPLAAKARVEVDSLAGQQFDSTFETRSLDRLSLILAHIRGHT